jgi:hypothetical protein
MWSSGQSSWLQIRRPGFDSRHYQKKKVVGLERGPLSLWGSRSVGVVRSRTQAMDFFLMIRAKNKHISDTVMAVGKVLCHGSPKIVDSTWLSHPPIPGELLWKHQENVHCTKSLLTCQRSKGQPWYSFFTWPFPSRFKNHTSKKR